MGVIAYQHSNRTRLAQVVNKVSGNCATSGVGNTAQLTVSGTYIAGGACADYIYIRAAVKEKRKQKCLDMVSGRYENQDPKNMYSRRYINEKGK